MQNNEFQVYERNESNAYVTNGVMHIKPDLTVDHLGGNYEHFYNGYHYVEW